VRSFNEPDLFDNNVPFDNTTPIYLSNLNWKLGLRLLLELHYFSIFTENNENEQLIFPEFHGRYHHAKRTHRKDQQQNKITIGMPMNKLGNWLIRAFIH